MVKITKTEETYEGLSTGTIPIFEASVWLDKNGFAMVGNHRVRTYLSANNINLVHNAKSLRISEIINKKAKYWISPTKFAMITNVYD